MGFSSSGYGVGGGASGSGSLSLVEHKDLSSAADNFDFTGVTGSTPFLLILNIKNATGTAGDINVELNGDTTSTNYYSQELQADDTNVGGSRTNDNKVGRMGSSKEVTISLLITMTTDNFGVVETWGGMTNVGSAQLFKWYNVCTSGAITTIDQIKIVGDQNFDTNSTATLYQFSEE